jgi:hypothetical protein
VLTEDACSFPVPNCPLGHSHGDVTSRSRSYERMDVRISVRSMDPSFRVHQSFHDLAPTPLFPMVLTVSVRSLVLRWLILKSVYLRDPEIPGSIPQRYQIF